MIRSVSTYLAVFAFAVCAALAPMRASAQEIATTADHAILIDYNTGAVLFEKAAHERMVPASMTKMMTIYILMKRLHEGALSLDDTFPVSEKAWRKGGSKMFVEVGDRVRVEDLLRGIIVQSGNDATIVVAEALSGTEEAFAREMTSVAQEIGMTNTQFKNASGWPEEGHYTTAADLATLAIATIRDFPDMYHMYAETEFTYADITQQNRNPLLYSNIGADGLKTGHTEESGYGLTASAQRDGRRLVAVVNGLDSMRERGLQTEKLLNWGFREWKSYTLFSANETVDEAVVWLGEAETVPLQVQDEVAVTLRRNARDEMKVTAIYEGPVPAPLEVGQPVGTLRITAPGMETVEFPLVAGAAVAPLGPLGKATALLNNMLFGLLP